MSYAIKELFLTLQGEGMQMGRRAVFLRFAGCNLWSGREQDRAQAFCRFCDTDFVGTDGEGGGRFGDADALADAVATCWGGERAGRFIVMTGGEPMLQVDEALIAALHDRGFMVAIESNGTLPVPRSIDWICISPKAGSEVVQRSGDELKLIWPQPGSDWQAMAEWDFANHLIQPLDSGDSAINAGHARAAMDFVRGHPQWRLSLQTHKLLGIP